MLWKSSCNAEVAETQIQRQKCCLWLKIAENLFQLLAFPIPKTLQGVVKVTGWLCVCGACLRRLNTWFVLPICYGDLRHLAFLSSVQNQGVWWCLFLQAVHSERLYEYLVCSRTASRNRVVLQICGWESVSQSWKDICKWRVALFLNIKGLAT